MTEFYDGLQNTADQLIKQFGNPQTATLTRQQVATHDKVLNSVTPGTALTTPMSIVVLPANTGSSAFDNATQASLESIGQARVRFIIASALGVTFEPKAKDTLEFAGSEGLEKWEVIGCTPVRPADVTLLYKIGVMK